MTRRIHLQLAAIVSNDGARCAAECPHRNTPDDVLCTAFRVNGSPTNIKRGRAPACIAAEQAAASVPSCEGARGLDASEALREARVQGMREALEIVHLSDAIMSPRSMCSIERGIDAAIEAVRKGER